MLYAQGDADEALAWLDRCIARSDDGFRGRIAEVLLRQPDDRLRRAGAAALARRAPATVPPPTFAPKPGGFARFTQAVRRMRPFKPPGPASVSVPR